MEVLAVELIPLAIQVSNIAIAALGLGLVIFLHELGHFAVAKWCDVNVERFSIGFGPVFFSRKWGETEYALSLVPFGGYVKMLGQDDADPSQLTSEEIAEDPRSYVAKSVFQRMAIISAGVTMNILTALLFFAIAFMVGFFEPPSMIGDARPGMPAWVAGIRAGDKIEKMNDSETTTFTDLMMSVALSSGPIAMEGKHADGTPFEITVDPDAKGPHPQIGVKPMESLVIYDVLPKPQVSKEKLTPQKGDKSESAAAPTEAKPAFRKGDTIKKVGDQPVKDAVELHRALASNPDGNLSITVERKRVPGGTGEQTPVTETITIVDNYFRTLGLILDSGPIVAVQTGSPAEKADLRKGDKLASLDGLNIGTQIDPLKLPVEFAKRAGKEIEIVVTRQYIGGGQERVDVKLVPNDIPGWIEKPEIKGEPLSIPSIGVAFHILPIVLAVVPNSPADKAGIKPGPLKKMTLTRRPELQQNEDGLKDSPYTIDFDDSKHNNCAFAFWVMQLLPQRKVSLTVIEDGKPREVELTPQRDPEWPLPIANIQLENVMELQKATTFAEACSMSLKRTRTSALRIYLTLRSLVTGRVSYKELHGPLGIAKTAYLFAQEGVIAMLIFLGFLSVNLAVLNFLPIPVLDGGHMVFLLWEACARRKPNEKLLIGATYVGFAFLLCLMALVLYLDLFIHPFTKK